MVVEAVGQNVFVVLAVIWDEEEVNTLPALAGQNEFSELQTLIYASSPRQKELVEMFEGEKAQTRVQTPILALNSILE